MILHGLFAAAAPACKFEFGPVEPSDGRSQPGAVGYVADAPALEPYPGVVGGGDSCSLDARLHAEIQAEVNNAIQRTIARVAGFVVETVRARLENDLGSIGLHGVDPSWLSEVAAAIHRKESPRPGPVRFGR